MEAASRRARRSIDDCSDTGAPFNKEITISWSIHAIPYKTTPFPGLFLTTILPSPLLKTTGELSFTTHTTQRRVPITVSIMYNSGYSPLRVLSLARLISTALLTFSLLYISIACFPSRSLFFISSPAPAAVAKCPSSTLRNALLHKHNG